jgi:hypothetical protein
MPPAVKRRLVTLAAAASLLLCVALLVLWVRNHLDLEPSFGPSADNEPREEKLTGAISGRVVDAEGQPIAERRVVFEFKPQPGQGKFSIFVTTTPTGEFTCEKMKPGRYLLWCGSPDLGWVTEEVEAVPGEEIGVGELQLTKQ